MKLLSKFDVKATFFILGWISERKPDIVKRIYDEGHEIASHGYSHRSVYELTQDEFRQEIEHSINLLRNIINDEVIGYRAPNYSIRPETAWAWEILTEYGIKYDSSIFPVKHNRYGFDSAPRFPFRLDLNSHGKLIEFPLSTIQLLGNNIPVAGGAYLRLYPFWFIKNALKQINSEGMPGIIYFHPWELDPEQPKLKANFGTKIKHYGNLNTTEYKLKKLLKNFQFTTIKDILGLAIPKIKIEQV